MKDVFEEYFPENDLPLIVSFANHLYEHGYSTVVGFDFWDLRAYLNGDEPEISILTVKNHLNSHTVQKISDSTSPYKVILIEGDGVSLRKLEHQSRFLAMFGVGVYLRNAGWLILPGKPKINVTEDLMYQVLDRYSQDDEGNWGKECTKCGIWKPETEYYNNPNPTARDPRRNLCKECFG